MPSQRARMAAAALGWATAAGAAYFLLALVGFRFAQFSGNVSPVWPATGLAIAAGILLGWRALPGLFAAAWAAHAINGLPWWAAGLIAAANTAEAGLAAWAVGGLRTTSTVGREAFHAPRGVFRFASGVLGASWISATVGVVILGFLGDIPAGSRFGAAVTWYLGDVTGALVVTPVLVLAAHARPRFDARRALEGGVLMAALGLIALLLFAGLHPPGWSIASLSVLCVPPLAWAAFRLGPTFTAAALLGVDAVAIAATFSGAGPFQAGSADATMTLLQVFVGTLSLLLLPLAALADEGRRANEELEHRVLERTARLEALNLTLRQEVAQRRVAEERADEAQRLAQLGSWRLDLAADRLESSRELRSLFGLPPDAAPEMHAFIERLVPGDRDRVRAALAQARHGAPLHATFAVELPDGRRRTLVADGVPERGTAGGPMPAALVGVIRDITEQAEREAAVRESLDRFRVLADSSPVGVFHTDPQGRVDYANLRWREIAGCDPMDMDAIRRAVHPDDQPELAKSWRACMAGGVELVADFRYVHADGKVVQCHTRATPVRDAQGVVTGYVGTLEDITERRDAEAKERELQRLSEQAAFKTNFLRTAAHELGTPLTPLKIQVRILKGLLEGGSDRERKAIDILDRNVHRLSLLVRDLLESARLQSSRMKLSVRPFDLADTVHDVIETFQDQAIQAGIVLDLRGPPHVATEGDPDRIAQVLFNLLSNAMKFTPSGGRIHVDISEGPEWTRVVVQDDGSGFTPQQAAQLFQPFVQIHDEMRQPRGGSGLGLYISRGIVEQHGGTMSAHSEGPGKGATFTVQMPRHVPLQVPVHGISVTARV